MALEITVPWLLVAWMYFRTLPASFLRKSGLSCCDFFEMERYYRLPLSFKVAENEATQDTF